VEMDYIKYVTSGLDKDAVLRDLMDQYGNDVWNFAYFLIRRPGAADDISQEVFLTVFDKMHTFRGECSIKSWLLTITRNKSFKYLKNAFISKVTLVDYVFRKETVKSAESVVFDRMETRHIWNMVLKLPHKFREVLLLTTHFQLTVQDMAIMLGLPEGTIKSRLHRARHKLSVMLDNNPEGGSD
jgi:RNA polymerase sigma-70 factor, ECF subfamily